MSPAAVPRLSFLARVGAATRGVVSEVCYLVAVLARILRVAFGSRAWTRTTRNVLARQVYFTGVGALKFTLLLAFLIGISVVLQTKIWLEQAGQELLFGPILTAVVVRELAPLIVNIVVLVRSGSAIVTELATMTVSGEVRLLEAQGIDPLEYLVLPRVVGVTLSVCCLTVFFIVGAFASGYLLSLALSQPTGEEASFMSGVLASLHWQDLVHLVAKMVVPVTLTTLLCAVDGLGAGSARTDIPKAATRALSRAIAALFLSSAALSIVSYL